MSREVMTTLIVGELRRQLIDMGHKPDKLTATLDRRNRVIFEMDADTRAFMYKHGLLA